MRFFFPFLKKRLHVQLPIRLPELKSVYKSVKTPYSNAFMKVGRANGMFLFGRALSCYCLAILGVGVQTSRWGLGSTGIPVCAVNPCVSW